MKFLHKAKKFHDVYAEHLQADGAKKQIDLNCVLGTSSSSLVKMFAIPDSF